MTDATLINAPTVTDMPWLSEQERGREHALREHFATFWATETGTQRSIYDRFIAASPLADGIDLEEVSIDGVHGWWVRPRDVRSEKAILYVHGGAYVFGSAEAYRGFVSQIVSRTGIAAFVIDYPLAPEASLPSAPQAARAAWNYVVGQGYGQIAIVGDSAGGGLSLVTLTELVRHPEGPAPVAGVVFSPWADLTFTGRSMTDPNLVDPLIGHEYLADCAQKYVGAYSPADPLASPLFGDLHGLPPLLIQVGTDERLLDDSRQFAERAARAGVTVELEIWEGMHHVFQLDVAHLDTSRVALDRAARFLGNAFHPATPGA